MGVVGFDNILLTSDGMRNPKQNKVKFSDQGSKYPSPKSYKPEGGMP